MKLFYTSVVAAALVFTGCGGGSSSTSTPATNESPDSSTENTNTTTNGDSSSTETVSTASGWLDAYQTAPEDCSPEGLTGYTDTTGLDKVPCAVTLTDAEAICNAQGARLPTSDEFWLLYWDCVDTYGNYINGGGCLHSDFPLQPDIEEAYWIEWDAYEHEQMFNWAAGSQNGPNLEGYYALVRCIVD
jgi:hypothetical protein